MFENLFKKGLRHNPVENAERATSPAPSTGDNPDQPTASTDSLEQTKEWQNKLIAAGSDESTLLQFAYQAPTTELKLMALQALRQEDSFKQAMREFREQDKRLYRAAKGRWEAARDQRVATAEANGLVAAARALLEQEQVPANRLVELERQWSAVNSALLDTALAREFTALSAQLSSKVRMHSEHTQSLTRWLSAVDGTMERIAAMLPRVAQGEMAPTEPEGSAVELLELLRNVPVTEDQRGVDKVNLASRQLALASSVAQRAQFLHALPAPDAVAPAQEKVLVEQWRAFPELSEDGANPLHSVLAQRFADWRNASMETRQREQDARGSQKRAQRAHQDQQRLDALQRHIEAAEVAQADGHVAELAGLLEKIDEALKRSATSSPLAQRIESLRREHARLRDWQRWSGGQSREQLVVEAQDLARLATGSISIKVHGDAINKLRERWKELDKLGGASNQSVWLAFDGALKSAYEPIATHLEKLKQARLANLAARNQIIADLAAATSKYLPAAPEGDAPGASAQPDWRTVAQMLQQARIAWQKLGPVEHTVPRAALQGDKAVTARYAAAVQALEAPLQNTYREARQQREQLIRAATDLGATDVSARDVVDKVRKLQTQWQSVAKALALPRGDENALWTAFKTAIDAVFSARDATRVAKEVASNEQLKAREEIIDRLAAFAANETPPDIKRALADADSTWRSVADVAKPLRAKLEARYQAARDAVAKRLAELAARASQARFDALIAAMALCDEREATADSSRADNADGVDLAADLETRWNSIAHLPVAWKAPLDARFGGKPGGLVNDTTSLLESLLNLEAACGLESPDEFLAARRELKMRALKSALEARQNTVNTPADIERWLLAAAAYPRPDTQSRERLAKVIAALRVSATRR